MKQVKMLILYTPIQNQCFWVPMEAKMEPKWGLKSICIAIENDDEKECYPVRMRAFSATAPCQWRAGAWMHAWVHAWRHEWRHVSMHASMHASMPMCRAKIKILQTAGFKMCPCLFQPFGIQISLTFFLKSAENESRLFANIKSPRNHFLTTILCSCRSFRPPKAGPKWHP